MEADSPLRAILDHAGIPVRSGSLQTDLGGLETAADPVFEPVLAELASFSGTGHPDYLSRARSVAGEQGLQMWAFFDPETQLTYLRVQGRGVHMVTPIGLSGDPIDTRFLPAAELPA